MKALLYIILIFTTFFSACKNEKKLDNQVAANVSTPADLGALYQYYHANASTLDQRDENTLIEYAADKNMEVIRTKSGVYIHTIAKGNGDQIKWGDPIAVDYKGYTLDGKEFDSSYDRGEPISFRVGNMNPGWNEALPYLTRGTKATFLIPSHMGYGKKGFPGYIDPDTNIAFDVHVLESNAEK